MRGLESKTALITGAARGIGLATVERFANEGAKVVAVDRSLDSPPENENIKWLEADVVDAESMARAVQVAVEMGGRLDVCIANADINRVESFLEGTLESWDDVLRVNLLGVMLTLQAAAQQMVTDDRGGRLLATASIAGVHGEPETPAYCASKGAVIALIQALAVELGPQGITANAIAPGQIDTEMNARDSAVFSAREGRELNEFRGEFLAQQVPAQRMGEPQEVAALFAFLASDEAPFLNGETVRIDGGELAI